MTLILVAFRLANQVDVAFLAVDVQHLLRTEAYCSGDHFQSSFINPYCCGRSTQILLVAEFSALLLLQSTLLLLLLLLQSSLVSSCYPQYRISVGSALFLLESPMLVIVLSILLEPAVLGELGAISPVSVAGSQKVAGDLFERPHDPFKTSLVIQ